MRNFSRIAVSVVLSAAIIAPAGVLAAPTGTVLAQAQSTVTLSVRVRAQGDKAIGAAEVIVAGASGKKDLKSDAQGNVTFNVKPGLYSISVNRGGYQSASQDVVVGETATTVSVTLTASDLSNLQVIGRTSSSSTRNAAQFNTSSSSQTSLSAETINERDPQDLTQLLGELPGVQINTIGSGGSSTTATPNTSLSVRGFVAETKTLIEGHPVSSGVFGTVFSQFLGSGLIQSVDVLKGAGLNGASAGQSAVGTINFKTYDFTAHDSGFLKGGVDQYGGSQYTVLIDRNFLPNNRLSIILGKSANGYRGPQYGDYVPNFDYSVSPSAASQPAIGTYLPQNDSGIINGLYDLSNTWVLQSELAKLRYKFSDATWFQFEFFGAQGRYNPQGGSYASLEGNVAVSQCVNGGAAASGANCTASSTYNAPWVSNLIGTTVPGYSFFPGSYVANNNPNFNAELRTTIKNDTLILRPYTAVINRNIDGSGEVGYPGDGGAWYQVTNPANCTVKFTAANALGASGPCFTSTAGINTPAYVIDPSTPHSFSTQSSIVPGCSKANPCYTTNTSLSNGGIFGYGTPFSQPELDRLNGYTFSYLHPFGSNNFSLQFDHFMDDTEKLEGDTSPLGGIYANCTPTVLGGANPAVGTLGYQSCVPVGTTLPTTSLQIPETVITQSDLSLDLQYTLAPKLQLDFGNYFTVYKAFAQVEDPSVIASYALYGLANKSWTGSANIAPVALTGVNASYSHYDPHVGLVYRPSRNIALRASGGSSISTPYAQQLSGLTKITLASQAQQNGQNVITEPNSALKPEETVAFDLGAAFRAKNGAVFDAGLYAIDVHNAWESFNLTIPTPAGIPDAPGGTVISQYQNVSQHLSRGLELSYTDEPALGLGFAATTSFNRTYLHGLPGQLNGTAVTPYEGEQLSGAAYAKGYAEIAYRWPKDSLISFGTEYNGPNNSYYVPAFFLYNTTVRFQVAKNTTFQFSAQNFFDTNLNTELARATYAAGTAAITQTINTNGTTTYGNKAQDIFAVPFQTFRFSLTYKL